jgi:hypothetical protein
MATGINDMAPDLGSVPLEELISEVIQRGGKLIITGKLQAGYGHIYHPIPASREEDPEYVVEFLQEVHEYIGETIEVLTKELGPSCLTCGWYGFQYHHDGYCPVCRAPLARSGRKFPRT